MDKQAAPVSFDETTLSATREAGLTRLARYVPRVKNYRRERNVDRPGHTNVSMLSMYLKYRLLLEAEVVGSVLSRYRHIDAEKFLQEVLWRTYWKGWLERHPTVWDEYLRAVQHNRGHLSKSQRIALHAATHGETEISCFNHWVNELVSTGYLHNHARMWFASIWIFTLRLPWSLGAAFFLRHLQDGDPASNTLSWRWVAGLHTRGKHYLARATNIERYTEGRFNPVGQLNEEAHPLAEDSAHVAQQPVERPAVDLQNPAGLLLTADDLAPEASELRDAPIAAIAGGWSDTVTRGLDLSPAVVATGRMATRDALSRASQHFGGPVSQLSEDNWASSVATWATYHRLKRVLCLEAPVGPWRDELERARALLAHKDIELCIHRRSWDECLWPYASAGYFRFKQRAWPFLEDLAA